MRGESLEDQWDVCAVLALPPVAHGTISFPETGLFSKVLETVSYLVGVSQFRSECCEEVVSGQVCTGCVVVCRQGTDTESGGKAHGAFALHSSLTARPGGDP